MEQSLDLFEPLAPSEVEAVLQLKETVAPIVQKHPELQLFANDWAYVRFLRARQWSLPKATKMLQATLAWRLEAKPHAITWAEVAEEAASGKNFVSPFPDREGRPVVTMRPRNQNTGDERAQVLFLIYCLEHASRLADRQRVGKMTWLVDFVGYSMRNAPSVRTSIEVLHTLQNHYPERLGCAVCYSAPSLFSLTWKAISPFIDPVTKRKVDFVDRSKQSLTGQSSGQAGEDLPPGCGSMEAHFNMVHIESCMGGQYEGELFDLERYKARMTAEDAEVAAAIEALAAGNPLPPALPLGTASVSSNLSELTSFPAARMGSM